MIYEKPRAIGAFLIYGGAINLSPSDTALDHNLVFRLCEFTSHLRGVFSKVNGDGSKPDFILFVKAQSVREPATLSPFL